MVISMANTVDHRITHHDIGMRHINFETQNMFTILELAIAHFAKEGQIFFRATLTIGTIFSSLSKVATISMNIIRTLAIDIRFAILNQNFCKLIQSIKVIAGMIKMCTPIKSKPLHSI